MNGELYRHKKSKKLCIVLMGLDDEDIVIEATMEPAIVYRELTTCQIFIRPASEFLDGRFEQVVEVTVNRVLESL